MAKCYFNRRQVMCVKVFSSPTRRIIVTSTTEVFQPTTEWMPIPAYKAWQFNLLLNGVVGTFTARPGVQLALVRPEVPVDPQALGTATSTEGFSRFTPTLVDVGDDLTGAFFWRFGVMCKSGGAVASADVSLEAQVDLIGEVIGKGQALVQPYTIGAGGAGTVTMHPLTGWVSTLQLEAVKAAIIVKGNLNNRLQNRLYVRYANDPQAPGVTWAALEGGWATASNENVSRSTGAVTLGAISYNYCQFALGVQSSDGTAIRADIHAAVAAVRQ